ncbi:hypothetical protein [Stappia sp.]|uniref:hypothetical protein n=1 Tax=Stappia sp. TaxID=1870903 RepID=UPI0032D91ED4
MAGENRLPGVAFDGAPPVIWLTSAWGFDPQYWGYLGFTKESDRAWFLKEAGENPLVAIYVSDNAKAPEPLRGRLAGILRLGSQLGTNGDFMPKDLYQRVSSDPDTGNRWTHAVQALQAWKVLPGHEPPITELAPLTLGPSTGKGNNRQTIGRRGRRMEPDEARKLLDLPVVEVPVYGGRRTEDTEPAPLSAKLATSRAVARSTSPYTVDEDDSPKHLYILRLNGHLPHFLGRADAELAGLMVAKVGYSKAPDLRCHAFNRAMPACAFRWEVWKTEPGDPPHADWSVAQAGEEAMKQRLEELQAEPLGGEFYLASEASLLAAWRAGQAAAKTAAKEG